MLNNLFKPSVSRSEYDRAIRSFEDTLATAIKQRDEAQQEHAQAVDRELHTTELLQRALILLNEVDPARSGGKQLRTLREVLFADAMLAGLWGESKE